MAKLNDIMDALLKGVFPPRVGMGDLARICEAFLLF